MKINKNYNYPIYLAYLGGFPFLACAIIKLFNIQFFLNLGDVIHLSVIYALMICSFMAGTHWGMFFNKKTSQLTYLLWSSNLQVILLYVLFFLLPLKLMLWAEALSFIFLLFVDYKLKKTNITPALYFQMRIQVTSVVIICLLIMIYS